MSLSLIARNAGLTATLGFALFFAAACGDDAEDGGGSGDDDPEAGESGRDSSEPTSGRGSGGRSPSGGTGSLDDSGVPSTGDADAAAEDSGAASMDDAGPGDPPDAAALGPARVELGSRTNLAAAGSYVLLAKTGITNVTGSRITGGHLGLSPEAASMITGFALVAHSTNVYSTSVAVVAPAKVYAADYEPPTPSNLTTAVLDMEAAYSDAAGRSNPDFLNMADGNIGGKTLAPGLYKWGTGVTIPNDVTISGAANDVWIFQISNDLDVSSAKRVILSGGARARNIFWQVAGQVTIHADAHFEGIILSQTGITLQTGASMNGRALAQSLIALDDNAVTAP
jgi:hypothetical protein